MCCIMGYAGHDLSKETFTAHLLRTASRGPDDQRVCQTEFGLLGFGRLAIMGLTPEGMQPFFRGGDCVVCNGELYGFRSVKKELEAAKKLPAVTGYDEELKNYQSFLSSVESFMKDMQKARDKGAYSDADYNAMSDAYEYGLSVI